MNFISHRRNTIAELHATDIRYGVEVDIRSYGSDLVIHHDPFVNATLFKNWLREYNHGTLILNVKEEGLEDRLLELMRKHDIDNFFFLDQSFPFLVKTARSGESRCAIRVSEFESIDSALALAGKIDWVWIDCFSKFPLDNNQYKKLKGAGYKLCLVSPELQGRTSQDEILDMANLLNEREIVVDAICTKNISIWETILCN
uniref:phosphatidylinositol-specific phospholipase C/glycerophosphodiester phosphodiesterase family protein n=1 Tax=Flavobacterium sp. TaxID=239 RepID=UPI0040474810